MKQQRKNSASEKQAQPEKEKGKKTILPPRRTLNQALAEWGRLAILGALTGSGLMFFPRLAHGMGRSAGEPSNPDLDIDVYDPRLLARLVEQRRKRKLDSEREALALPEGGGEVEKQAEIPWSVYMPAGILAALGSGAVGAYGARQLADFISDISAKRRLERARRRFRDAMIAEQMASVEGEGHGPFSPFFEKVSMRKDGGWGGLADVLLTPVTAWSVPAGVITFFALRDYFKKKDPDWAKYNKSLKALKQRMATEAPYAQLITAEPEEVERAVEGEEAEEKEASAKQALWPFGKKTPAPSPLAVYDPGYTEKDWMKDLAWMSSEYGIPVDAIESEASGLQEAPKDTAMRKKVLEALEALRLAKQKSSGR